ncbi:MAG: serine/threonine-protein kinase PknK [Clostridiaceae bacterium]|nr:serine/threonine-protein kinase PknK [Clostridiaceae bacterium]
MLVLPDYIIHEQVCTRENGKVEIYRGYSAVHKTPVIIKVFKQESATPADISKFVNEYVLTRELEIKSIVKPARLVASENYFAMVFDEDDESISLKKYCRETPMELPVFLDIAIQLTKAVGELHQDGIIHRNLRPENISINPSTREIKISNFSLATRFPSKGEVNPPSWDISVNTGLENLQYMSPEQLGIVKDIIDHRSDYYSLGVIFYEMLTGRLPFQGASHAEWIRVHATQKPEAPDKINPGIPTPLSAIILKLLSKTASERYHTAYNLLDDLKECKRQWDNTGKIEPFDIESGNLSRILELPRRIFGREAEIKELKTSLGLACEGRGKLVLLSGYAGTGKTKLINEIIMPAAMEKGYYGYGKFNQYNHGMPYKPVIDALGSIVRQVMTESRENLESWRSEILRALGRSGSVITELIPEVEMIIGRQPSVEPLQPKEAQNRFLILFGNFLKVFTERNAPVVIFLDDLQWADTASLHLLKYLCEYTDMNHLLIIGAHRSNEIHENHPLWATIEELQKKRIPLHEIYISSFNMKEVTEYLAEAFKCHYRNDDLNTLAEMLYRKTCGNPFFLRQMIETAYEERLVTFNIHNNCWQWDMDSIQKLCMPDDVVGLIHLKLQKLPGETLDILKHASCMGSTFDMKILSVACKKTYVEAYSLLLPAIMEGLVLPVSHSGKVLQASYNYNIVDINEFLHDKIRQAVYSLFSEKDKKETHVKIGRLILQNFYTDESDENIMTIMDHFNRGLELITDPGERLKLAGYNLQAGKKAKSASAYDSAIAYFTAGISLLPGDAWDSCYNLCFELHLGCAKCEYMLGNMDKVEKLLDLIISRAGTGQEKLDLYGMKMMLYAGTGKYSEAVQIGTDVLGKLGMKLPAKPGILDYFKELLFYKWHMRGKKAEDLYKLPEMKDPVQKKVAEFLVRIILTSCTDYPDLYSFAIIKIGNHALKYGNTEIASAGYIGYSIVEGSVFNNYEKGYEIGKVVIALAEKYNKSFLKCLVYFTHGALLYHWTNHAKGAFKYLQKAINCANEAGNVLLAGYSYGVILEKNTYWVPPLKKYWL